MVKLRSTRAVSTPDSYTKNGKDAMVKLRSTRAVSKHVSYTKNGKDATVKLLSTRAVKESTFTCKVFEIQLQILTQT